MDEVPTSIDGYGGRPIGDYLIRVDDHDGKMVVGIGWDGSVEYGPAFHPSPWRKRRAAKRFWEEVANSGVKFR